MTNRFPLIVDSVSQTIKELPIGDNLDLTGSGINGGTIDGTVIGGSTPAAITGTTITGTSFASSGDMTFGDNDKAIFGAGSDLQIFAISGNSYISEGGAGSLSIRAADLLLRSPTDENYVVASNNGAVTLYYDNAAKLATTSTGVDVTGTVTADGLTVDANSGNIELQWAAGSTHKVGSSFSTTYFTGMRVTESSRNTDIISLDASGIGNINLFTGSAETKRMSVDPSGDISFYEDTGTTPKFFWDASAEALGIGTSAPNNKAQVSYTSVAAVPSAGAGGHGFAVGDSGFGIAAGALTSGNGYLQATRWDGSATNYNLILQPNGGSVGIGTSSPFNDTGYTAIDIRGSTGGQINFGTTSTRYGQISSNATNGLVFNTTAAIPMLFFTNGNERMRIDSNGNVGIGTSSDVLVAGYASKFNFVYPGGGSRYGFALRPDADTTTAIVFCRADGAAVVGSITQTASATAYNTSSDYRLKEDVQPMAGSVDRLMALKPVNFAWKADGSRVDGFIAHEAQEVVPEAVTGTKDAVDADGNPEYQGIDQSKIVPLLTAALQEALKRIEALEAQLNP